MTSNFQTDQIDLDSFDPNDLHWLAFCYIADELDPAEREAFEIRLQQEQPARDAVADAVKHASLVNASLAATSLQTSSVQKSQATSKRDAAPNKIPMRRASILAAAAAVLLVTALVWYQTPGPSIQPNGDELAEVWSNEAWNSDVDTFSSDSFGDLAMDEMIDDSDRTEVTWLVAALDTSEETYDPHELDSTEFDEGDMPCF